MKQIEVFHKTLEDGSKIVHIPLKNSFLALTLDEEGYETLMSLGIHPVFQIKQDVVCFRSGQRRVALGRVLADCEPGETVKHLNGQICDFQDKEPT